MKDEKLFTLSKEGTPEYSASVVQIGELFPIEGSDFLCRTVVDGMDLVVRKDECKPGDVFVYVRIETTLADSFLSKNNLYDLHSYEKNANASQVEALLKEGKNDEAKTLCGYINHTRRVRTIRLRGQQSCGILLSKDSLVKWNKKLKDIDLSEYLDIPYWDTIWGEEFVKVYIPYYPESRRSSGGDKQAKKLKRFNRMIPGQFNFHYDTTNINKEIRNINPNDIVTLSVKIHGTSFIISNCKIKTFENTTPGQDLVRKRLKKLLGIAKKRKDLKRVGRLVGMIKPGFKIGYGVVYSSRKVIKNQYINKGVSNGYYDEDVWADYYKLLKKILPKGISLYGEIFGYCTGDKGKMIQKNYDYGCKPGENKLMIYRITETNEEGERKEFSVPEVLEWTKKLLKNHPELKDKIHPIDILYNGTLANLYPEISTTEHWHENVLEALKNDKTVLGMEETEPLCKNKVPREGIVIRIDKRGEKGESPVCAWKLKSYAFLNMEAKLIDKGEVDIEMSNKN